MCDHCENGHPTGVHVDDVATACNAQLAECLRDAIRSAVSGGNLELWSEDIDRYLNELVRRAESGKGE